MIPEDAAVFPPSVIYGILLLGVGLVFFSTVLGLSTQRTSSGRGERSNDDLFAPTGVGRVLQHDRRLLVHLHSSSDGGLHCTATTFHRNASHWSPSCTVVYWVCKRNVRDELFL